MMARFVTLLMIAGAASLPVRYGRVSDVARPQLHRDTDARGPLPVLRAGKWGYISASGVVTIAPRFDEAGFFYEGRAAVRLGALWGYIDTTGSLVIPPQFTRAGRFSDNVAHVGWNIDGSDRSGYVDLTGQIVIRCDAGSADVHLTAARCGRPFSGGYVAEAIEVFRCDAEPGNPREYPCRGLFVDRWGYYDKAGWLAIPGPFHSGAGRFSDGLAAVRRYGDSGVGFIDASAEFVVAPEYDEARPFSEGLAAVRIDRDWGFIDRRGRRVVKLRFLGVSDFSDGYAAVNLDGAWGYIDRTGRFAVSPRFREVAQFSEGLAAVCCDGDHTRYIDLTGKWAFETVLPRGILNAGAFVDGIALVDIRGVGAAYIDRAGRIVAPVRSPD